MSPRTVFKATELREFPHDWRTAKIREITAEVRSGFASGQRDEKGIVQIRMNNVTRSGRVILDKHLKVPVPNDKGKYVLSSGDVLFNNTNSFELVGKSAISEGA